jgi:hypothetical protein
MKNKNLSPIFALSAFTIACLLVGLTPTAKDTDMNLPPYVFIMSNDDLPGAGYILQTQEPYYIGRVVKIPEGGELAILEHNNVNNPLVHSQIPNYGILITFAGTINGNQVRVQEGSKEEWRKNLQKIYDGMADYFYRSRILTNPGQYKRYYLSLANTEK